MIVVSSFPQKPCIKPCWEVWRAIELSYHSFERGPIKLSDLRQVPKTREPPKPSQGWPMLVDKDVMKFDGPLFENRHFKPA